MASPCEVHVADADRATADRVVSAGRGRSRGAIEAKFSRYRRGNVIDAINTAGGRTVIVDEETARLLDYAAQLHELSDGKFDVTSGRAAARVALRRQRPRAEPRARRRAVADRRLAQGSLATRRSSRSRPAWRSISAASARSTPSTARRRSCAPLSTHCLLNFGGDLLGARAASRRRAVACRHRVA